MVTARQRVAITGIAGAGTGVALPTLAAEFTSRATGQTGWPACGVKAAVKGVLGLVFYALSGRVGESLAMFTEIFAYSSWGSIILDIAFAAYPGGIPGMAEDAAAVVRTAAAGGKRVVRELGTIERRAAGGTVKASAVF